ncbi:hypothetical protein J6590_026519 [Homalodisca vitripennis]|nr:hypothetical protein J6590_026519 [Homalodisca vitripennis]
MTDRHEPSQSLSSSDILRKQIVCFINQRVFLVEHSKREDMISFFCNPQSTLHVMASPEGHVFVQCYDTPPYPARMVNGLVRVKAINIEATSKPEGTGKCMIDKGGAEIHPTLHLHYIMEQPPPHPLPGGVGLTKPVVNISCKYCC